MEKMRSVTILGSASISLSGTFSVSAFIKCGKFMKIAELSWKHPGLNFDSVHP